MSLNCLNHILIRDILDQKDDKKYKDFSKIFRGELLEAGKDHIIIRDNQTRVTYLLLSVYLSYVTFDENIEYDYPFQK